MASLKLIPSLSVLLALAISAALAEPKDPWLRIDEHLFSKALDAQRDSPQQGNRPLKLLDPARSFQAAEKWLLKKQKPHSCMPLIRSDDGVVNALEKLVNMKNIIDEKNCSPRSRALLNELIAVASSGNYRLKLENLISNYLVTEFAKECQREYMVRFNENRNRFVEKSLERVRIFFMDIIYSRIDVQGRSTRTLGTSYEHFYVKWAENSLIRHILYRSFILESNPLELESDRDASTAFEAIEFIVTHHSACQFIRLSLPKVNGRWVYTAKRAQDLFTVLIYNSCIDYMEQAGPNLFDLAQADVGVLARQNIFELEEAQWADYYLSWAAYRGCKSLVNKSQERLEVFLAKIGRIAEQRSQEAASGSQAAESSAAGASRRVVQSEITEEWD